MQVSRSCPIGEQPVLRRWMAPGVVSVPVGPVSAPAGSSRSTPPPACSEEREPGAEHPDVLRDRGPVRVRANRPRLVQVRRPEVHADQAACEPSEEEAGEARRHDRREQACADRDLRSGEGPREACRFHAREHRVGACRHSMQTGRSLGWHVPLAEAGVEDERARGEAQREVSRAEVELHVHTLTIRRGARPAGANGTRRSSASRRERESAELGQPARARALRGRAAGSVGAWQLDGRRADPGADPAGSASV